MYALHAQSQWQRLHPYDQGKKPNIRPHVMPMDSSYYQLVLSLLVVAGARRVMIFLQKVLKTNSKGNESVYKTYSNYWLSRLSCCLQKSIAASIVNRSKLINGDMFHNPNYQFDEDFILESGFRH
jgi:hypothetical protein